MVKTRSSRNALVVDEKAAEKYCATEYEWDEEPDEDHPAKKLEVRRTIVSPKSKRGRECTGTQWDESEDEDYKGCWKKSAKRFEYYIPSTRIIKANVKDSFSAKLFKIIPLEVSSFPLQSTPTIFPIWRYTFMSRPT